jgi:hypothetical protein
VDLHAALPVLTQKKVTIGIPLQSALRTDLLLITQGRKSGRISKLPLIYECGRRHALWSSPGGTCTPGLVPEPANLLSAKSRYATPLKVRAYRRVMSAKPWGKTGGEIYRPMTTTR